LQFVIFEAGPGWLGAAFSGAGLFALTLPASRLEKAIEKLIAELGWANDPEEFRENTFVVPAAFSGPEPIERDLGVKVEPDEAIMALVEKIRRYFAREETDLFASLDWAGYTSFQRKVLEVVQAIPPGTTRSYGEVARLSGSPRAARAVGGVMRANRTPLVVPCHRVITASGDIGCFGGGREMKQFLLDLEKNVMNAKDYCEDQRINRGE